jgi:hypothetical protein
MKEVVSKAGAPSQIEALADELCLRDLHVTLAPDFNNELMLEVVNSRLDFRGAAVRAGQVYWRDGAFWWSRLAEPEWLPDIASAVERITASLRWWNQSGASTPPLQSGDTEPLALGIGAVLRPDSSLPG